MTCECASFINSRRWKLKLHFTKKGLVRNLDLFLNITSPVKLS